MISNNNNLIAGIDVFQICYISNNHVHISYYSGTSATSLKYATNSSGSWVVTEVDNLGDAGEYTSIALDSSGYPHIGYIEDQGGGVERLKHAYTIWNGASWALEYLLPDSVTLDYPSIAINSTFVRPIALGRRGVLKENNPRLGRSLSPRGCWYRS